MNDALFEKRKAAALRLRECIRDKTSLRYQHMRMTE